MPIIYNLNFNNKSILSLNLKFSDFSVTRPRMDSVRVNNTEEEVQS